MNGTPAWKGGAKRLKALLKATIRIVSFVFQESTPCFVDHRLKSSSSVTVRESPHRGFRRIHPAFPTLYFSSTMKATVVALIFVLIGWAILFPQPAAGHGIHYDVQQQGFSVRIFYSAQDAASYSEYEIYGPGDTIPHQTGRTDKNGYVSFFPDRAGAWKVKVLGESTHGFHGVTIDVNIDKGLNLESFS